MVNMKFPTSTDDIQLDIVGLLAVVGEAAMSGHVQPSTATWSTLLPRLLPAPQAFLKPDRPYRLPPNFSVVVGIRSGNFSRTLNFFPELLHGIDEVPRFGVRTITVRQRNHRLRTNGDSVIAVRRCGLMDVLAICGTVCFIGLLAAAIVLGDGMATIALLLLALTSSMIGLGSWWRVELQKRTASRDVPDGDVVVVGRQGGFLIVRCTEAVARELYFGQERCSYVVSDALFRALSAAGTFTFMAAVVFLASAGFTIQAATGLSYIVLNFAYWIAALLPGGWHWDFGSFDVVDEDCMTVAGSYTGAIVDAINATRETAWVTRGDAVPETPAWRAWLVRAGQNIGNAQWDGERALTECLAAAKEEREREERAGAAQGGGKKEEGDGLSSREMVGVDCA
ncbi:hypothetical protein EDC01DRAFT_635416 [Geopyxis carbonaria]|nr:hypothetical protein EDC01DRAFT_635416 [Geopyxis carbonaria]